MLRWREAAQQKRKCLRNVKNRFANKPRGCFSEPFLKAADERG